MLLYYLTEVGAVYWSLTKHSFCKTLLHYAPIASNLNINNEDTDYLQFQSFNKIVGFSI